MIYPDRLQKGDVIGVCAPSCGLKPRHIERLNTAIKHVEDLGYRVIETASVRKDDGKCASAPVDVRFREFMELYENPCVKVILPPWGGEFLMEILPLIDWDYIKTLSPKWIVGYSDITTLTFPFTLTTDIATVHGSNLMNMGFEPMPESDKVLFDFISNDKFVQQNSNKDGGFADTFDNYKLDKDTVYKTLFGEYKLDFKGRMIGGCIDAICKFMGTRYDRVGDFVEKYKADGIVWALESCEMTAGDIYRTLWQMKEAGWFKYAKGVLIGRAGGYSDNEGFTIKDALIRVFGDLNVPVIYDADIGHVPPQIQIMNGAIGTVSYELGKATILQEWYK
jgi:muramoyltetrapeptide carboxypeptidase LdcA involved in peptidoglycan recycling